MKLVRLLLSIAALILGVGLLGYLYDHRLAPLARLASDIEIGDPYSEVHRKFVVYREQAPTSGEVDFGARDARTGRWNADETAPANALYLADRGLFDDIRLTVEFDATGRVEQVNLVGD